MFVLLSLDDVGSAACEASPGSGGARQPIIVMERRGVFLATGSFFHDYLNTRAVGGVHAPGFEVSTMLFLGLGFML